MGGLNVAGNFLKGGAQFAEGGHRQVGFIASTFEAQGFALDQPGKLNHLLFYDAPVVPIRDNVICRRRSSATRAINMVRSSRRCRHG